MAERIRARDLMRSEFARIRTDQTLGDAMAALLETQRQARMPNALMVIDGDEQYRGMLTARLLIRLLVGNSHARSGQQQLEPELDDMALLEVAERRLAILVGDSLVAGIPVVTPDAPLLTLIRRGIVMRLDFLPVVDEGRPVGFAPVTAIFQSAAAMALTPEDEGVRFDR